MNTSSQFTDLTSRAKNDLLRTMIRIRTFELMLEKHFLDGKVPGFVHLYVGQEAIAAGVSANLRCNDYITSTHRGHGHCIAKDSDPQYMMAEILGKSTGYCKGKGGSMHIANFAVGILGGNGIVGGGFNIAAGAALSAKIRKTDQVAVCFFGDGASNRGTFHEALNLASVWKLPVIFVNENNRFASTTPMPCATACAHIADRAKGYNMPGVSVDGNDVIAVYDAAARFVARARNGEGPSLLECNTYRIKGHYVGDPEKYRSKEEVEKVFAENDPITRYATYLQQADMLADKTVNSFQQEAEEEMRKAIKFAEESPLPDPEDALNDLFSFSPNLFPEQII